MTQQALSTTSPPRRQRLLCMAAFVLVPGACGGSDGEEARVGITSTQPNVVSYWNDVANRTVNATSATNTTDEEQRPSYHVDLATVHVAIYDAVSAIDGRYEPFAITSTAPSAGASLDAAASAAAYGVLRALFPNRGAQYEAAYASRIDAIPAGDARTKGLALGREVAAAVVALRAEDGRGVVLAPYVSSTYAAWTPVLPTPNHPEYPAGHSCTSGALGETLRQYYGTRQVSYSFDSAVTGTTRTYATTDALDDESRIARLYGGMHVDFSITTGVELGVHVAQWVAAHHFGRRESVR